VTTCGVSTAGAGYCWGDNVYAQGGHSTTSDVATPTLVQGSHTWKSISAGTVSACGVTTTNEAWCWGSDTYGQLGDGGTISYSSLDTAALPVLVAGGLSWQEVSVGQYHACGLTTTGAAYCWGYNDYRVGDNTDVDRSAPAAVSGSHVFKSIDAGRYTTCAITTTDEAYCWGANLTGQFGTELPGDLSRVPVLAAGGMKFAEIRTSSLEHTCGISLDRHTVKCFGRNDYGQTGSGSTVASTVHNWTPTTVVGQHP
jgi:alpha-tubulin suppressor-like RCC1 family protein